MGVLFLGELTDLFSKATCDRITHRIIFNSHHTREAANRGWAKYQLMHLGDIPMQVREYFKPNVAMITVAGPDNGGNFSLGTTMEGCMAAIEAERFLEAQDDWDAHAGPVRERLRDENPANTMEWMAPMRAHAIMVMGSSIIMGR